MTPDAEKQAVARAAIAYVRDGMRLGLGSGSTARYFVDEVEEGQVGLETDMRSDVRDDAPAG